MRAHCSIQSTQFIDVDKIMMMPAILPTQDCYDRTIGESDG